MMQMNHNNDQHGRYNSKLAVVAHITVITNSSKLELRPPPPISRKPMVEEVMNLGGELK
jgi:hypothetical protein